MKLEEGKKILVEGTSKSNASVEKIMENGQKLEKCYETVLNRINETKAVISNIDKKMNVLNQNISINDKQLKKLSEIINLRNQTTEIDVPNNLINKKELTPEEVEEEEEYLEILESLTRDVDKEMTSKNIDSSNQEDDKEDSLNQEIDNIKQERTKNVTLLNEYKEKRDFYKKRLYKLRNLMMIIRKKAMSNKMSVINSINDISKIYIKCMKVCSFSKHKNKKMILIKKTHSNKKTLKKVKSK